MIKNAFLAMKKSIGKTLLLLVLMFVIANLIIAGLSIQSASSKSIAALQESLGNDVTLSTNFKNMMSKRTEGQSIEDVSSPVTIEMADKLKDLKYVESYNYTINTSVNSDSINAVSSTTEDSENSDSNIQRQMPAQPESSGDFTVLANTTMQYITDFTEENSTLISGRLLTTKDKDSNNCVIETNLAKENSLSVGDTFKINTTVNDVTQEVELTIVGIYEMDDSTQIGGMNRSNPVNNIYTDLTVGQTLTGSSSNITSATYYLDNPSNAEKFETLAKSKTDIDFETYTLSANDQMYQRNKTNLENTTNFATIFLLVVIVAGCAILGLILVLTIRNRYYEFGIFLSLGQSKLKIIGQQLVEIGVIAIIAFVLSLSTGKLVSNVISGMLENNTTNEVQMNMDDKQSTSSNSKGKMGMENAFNAPTNSEMDVSLTGENVLYLAGITGIICIVSTILPSFYVLRLSPREILGRKEG